MDLSKIIAIAGSPGLYRVMGQMKNGIVVESLTTGKRMPAYASHKISALEDISIYTDTEDVPLKDIMTSIREQATDGEVITHKASNDEIKAFFEQVIPAYDRDRVYVSDMKKVLRWYAELDKTGILDTVAEEEEGDSGIEDAEVIEEVEDTPAVDETPVEESETEQEEPTDSVNEEESSQEAEPKG